MLSQSGHCVWEGKDMFCVLSGWDTRTYVLRSVCVCEAAIFLMIGHELGCEKQGVIRWYLAFCRWMVCCRPTFCHPSIHSTPRPLAQHPSMFDVRCLLIVHFDKHNKSVSGIQNPQITYNFVDWWVAVEVVVVLRDGRALGMRTAVYKSAPIYLSCDVVPYLRWGADRATTDCRRPIRCKDVRHGMHKNVCISNHILIIDDPDRLCMCIDGNRTQADQRDCWYLSGHRTALRRRTRSEIAKEELKIKQSTENTQSKK